MPSSPRLVLLALALSLGACRESVAPLSVPEPDLFPEGRELLSDPSFSVVVNEILVRRGCAGHNCHGAPGGQAELMLTEDAGHNYSALVGHRATSEPFLQVQPGVPDSSYLVIKLEGRQVVGFSMPLGYAPLDSIDLGNIRNWIAAGARNN